jgi:hypothetical protein
MGYPGAAYGSYDPDRLTMFRDQHCSEVASLSLKKTRTISGTQGPSCHCHARAAAMSGAEGVT